TRTTRLTCLLFYRSGTLPHLLSFPTRRSSDLAQSNGRHDPGDLRDIVAAAAHALVRLAEGIRNRRDQPDRVASQLTLRCFRKCRSEEHTSELQSRENLVCRLLLEKKKKKNT